MVFTLSFNIAVSRVIIQHWQWQSIRYGPVKDVKSCLRTSNLTVLWKICSSTSALSWRQKIFRFYTSVLPWLPKTWCSASALPLCLDCQRSEVPLPLCLYCQRSEVPRPHFRSAFTSKNVKFLFRTSALPWPPNMWSSVSALPLCLDWQRSEVPLSAFNLCLDLHRFAVSLPHFRSILTDKDQKIVFSTNTVPSLPNMGSSASAPSFCLDCKRSVVSHFRSAFIPKDVNALHWLPKFCLFRSAVGSYYVFPQNCVLSYMKDA